MGFVDHLWQTIIDKFGHATALFIVSLAGAALWILGRYALRLLYQAWCFLQSRNRALSAVARVVTTDGAREGNGVWLTRPIHQPDDYKRNVKRSKILSIANLKGGVGKTTLAANIGAYLAKDWQKRVLLVDLDFQGSLSSMAFAGKDWLGGRKTSLAAKLVSSDLTPDLVADVAQDVNLPGTAGIQGGLKVITAYYDLAQADNRLMVEWLLQCKHRSPGSIYLTLKELFNGRLFRMHDVRYSLAEILHSESVQEAFDLIIIDCPPRLTTSEIQAFCASSHLLIPTIFDRTSAEAVLSLCGQVETLKAAEICPHLQYLGIVGTMWNGAHGIQPQTRALLEKLIAESKINVSLLPSSKYVPYTTKLVKNADEGIAYLVMPQWQDRIEIRNAIASLTEHISNQMGIPRPAHYTEAAE